MKRRIIAILLLAICCFVSPALADGVAQQLDYVALEKYVESWNRAMADYGLLFSFSASDSEGYISFGGRYPIQGRQKISIIESLINPDVPIGLLAEYVPYENSIALIYGLPYITEVPKAVEVYADGIKCDGFVGYYPAEQDGETDLYTLEFGLDSISAILNAKDAFMRLVTEQNTYFQEMNSDNMSALYFLWGVIADGVDYSVRTSEFYLDNGLLGKAIVSDDNNIMPTAAPVPFQTDYEAIDHAAQSVFLLEVYDAKDQLVATGSGFVAFDGGTMITNEHVIQDAAYIIAHSDQYKASYKLVHLKAVDQNKDIAILEFDEKAKVVPLAVDVQSRLLRGQPVTAIGSPKGVINTVSSGNISNIVYYSEEIPDYIQFTAPISPGSSGGALFDEKGAVVGLCVSYLKEGEAMYYAIPMKYVEEMYRAAGEKENITLAKYNDLPSVLPAVKLAEAALGDESIVLQWSTVSQAEAYEVYRKSESDSEFVLLATTTETAYVDSDVIIGQTYEYYVETVHGWCASTASNHVAFQMFKPTPTPTPKPTPTPSPTPVPQGKVVFQRGDVNEDILNIKFRLYELGYYSSEAIFDDTYNISLFTSVLTFQNNNKLQTTGIIDEYTYETIFSAQAVSRKTGTLTDTGSIIVSIVDEISGENNAALDSVAYARTRTIQYSRKEYKLNDADDEVLRLKEKLRSLGYYNADADLDNQYNKLMVERVKMFQKNNKLEQSGTIDYITLIKMYSSSCIKGKLYVAPTPKPTPEPDVTLVIPDEANGSWNYEGGNKLSIKVQVKNISSKKTVKAYELCLYTVDTWGNRLIPEDKVYVLSVESTIKPGQTKYSSYISLADRDKIDRVYVAVHRVKYSDGSIKTVNYHDYSYWEID